MALGGRVSEGSNKACEGNGIVYLKACGFASLKLKLQNKNQTEKGRRERELMVH